MMRVIAGALIVLSLVTVPAGATDPYEPVLGKKIKTYCLGVRTYICKQTS